MKYVNIFNDSKIIIDDHEIIEAQRTIEVPNFPSSVKVGKIVGFEKEHMIGVYYVIDPEQNNSLIVTGHSMYATAYRPLIGHRFNNEEEVKIACLKLYTPPDLD